MGIRKQLLDIATQQVETMTYDKVWLEVIVENKKANEWLESQGFIFDQKRIYKNTINETGLILAYKEI